MLTTLVIIREKIIELSDELVNDAQRNANIFHRSVPQQIEHWSPIGKIAEENPDLPYSFIVETLLALEEAKDGITEPYQLENDAN